MRHVFRGMHSSVVSDSLAAVRRSRWCFSFETRKSHGSPKGTIDNAPPPCSLALPYTYEPTAGVAVALSGTSWRGSNIIWVLEPFVCPGKEEHARRGLLDRAQNGSASEKTRIKIRWRVSPGELLLPLRWRRRHAGKNLLPFMWKKSFVFTLSIDV